MNRISFAIRGQPDRDRLADLAKTLAVGMRVEIKTERRSDAQNAKFWAMLRDVAEQVMWHGIKLTAEDYRYLFLDALKREVRIIPNLDGNGFVNLGRSSSDLSVSEMADAITLIEMFGANHGVIFREPDSNSAGAPPGRLDALAAEHAPPPSEPAAGATYPNPSSGNRQADSTDAPAAVSPPATSSAAGASNFEEASLLSDDWRHTYFSALTRPGDKKESLITRHELALQMLGGKPNESEVAWMRSAWSLVRRRNEQKISPNEYDAELRRLLDAA